MSDDDLVERVARAIDRAWLQSSSPGWGECARAAIEAIEEVGYVVVPREPTKKMIRAAANPGGPPLPRRMIWHAMIQAALEKDKANVR